MGSLTALVAALAVQATQPSDAAPPVSTSTTEAVRRSVGQTTYLDLEGGLGYSSNPHFLFGSDTDAANGYVSLHAVHSRITERTTTLLSAFGQETLYTQHYGSEQLLSVTGRHDAAVNEKLRIFVDANASYDKGGQLGTRIISVPDVPAFPGSPDIPPQILPPGTDFLAVTGRHYFFSGNAGGQLALGPRDNLTFSSGVERSVFKEGGSSDSSYWSVPASFGYDRQISSRANIGGRMGLVFTDYDGPGRVSTVTPQITGNLRLSERLTLNGAVGVSFSRVDDGLSTHHSTGIAANAALCNAGEHSHLCMRAAIDQQTATVAGPAKTISAGIDYSRDLNADSSIQLSVDGSHFSQPTSVISGRTFSTSTYYRAAGSYTRRFGHRFFGGVNLAARKLSEQGPDPKADLNASVFIRYRLGDLQ
jgi:hypothetical protein